MGKKKCWVWNICYFRVDSSISLFQMRQRTNEWMNEKNSMFFDRFSFVLFYGFWWCHSNRPGLHECVHVFLLHQNFNDINSFIYLNLFIRSWYRMDCLSIVEIWLAFVPMLPTTDKFVKQKSIFILFFISERLESVLMIIFIRLNFNWFTTRKINIETKYTHASNL